MGLSRHRDSGFEGAIQGQSVRSSAEALTPVQLINSSTLIARWAEVRQQFLIWCVPRGTNSTNYGWMCTGVCASLATAACKSRRSDGSMEPRLAESATQLDLLRHRYFDAFLPVFRSTLGGIDPYRCLELSYLRGWDRGRELRRCSMSSSSAIVTEFHQAGPQGRSAGAGTRVERRGAVSGQQKLVVCAMKLARGRFSRRKQPDCVFLVDDLPSELDRHHSVMPVARALECPGFCELRRCHGSRRLLEWTPR
jgi:DNA replication and repair protein RecF